MSTLNHYTDNVIVWKREKIRKLQINHVTNVDETEKTIVFKGDGI